MTTWMCRCGWQGSREEAAKIVVPGHNGRSGKDVLAEPAMGSTRSACPMCSGYLKVVPAAQPVPVISEHDAHAT